MKTKRIFLIFIFLIVIFSFHCGISVYYVKPRDWESPVKRDSVIQYYSRFLNGWKFYLDPGHGGKDRKNRGPAKDAIEADINLKVGLTLKEYLQKAGAVVYMSRIKDTTVDLIDRSRLSNQSGADIFISIHHNAVGGNDHFTNFTSTWYHSGEGDTGYSPANHDIAKYVQRDLAYVMGNSGGLGSFDGTLPDFSVYPGAGFSVLRNAAIPAILIEGSFFSSNYEEQRLKIAEFNEIEAWGVFRGLGKYLRAGIPKFEIVSESTFREARPKIVLRVNDPAGIKESSLLIKLDGQILNVKFDTLSNLIEVIPSANLSNGKHLLEAVIENKNGNHSFPFSRFIMINK